MNENYEINVRKMLYLYYRKGIIYYKYKKVGRLKFYMLLLF